MKKYKVPIYNPLTEEIAYYEESYISETGWVVIGVLCHVIMFFIIKWSIS